MHFGHYAYNSYLPFFANIFAPFMFTLDSLSFVFVGFH